MLRHPIFVQQPGLPWPIRLTRQSFVGTRRLRDKLWRLRGRIWTRTRALPPPLITLSPMLQSGHANVSLVGKV
jgi:hypothetical protein